MGRGPSWLADLICKIFDYNLSQSEKACALSLDFICKEFDCNLSQSEKGGALSFDVWCDKVSWLRSVLFSSRTKIF